MVRPARPTRELDTGESPSVDYPLCSRSPLDVLAAEAALSLGSPLGPHHQSSLNAHDSALRRACAAATHVLCVTNGGDFFESRRSKPWRAVQRLQRLEP
jgi:hypothetical protein